MRLPVTSNVNDFCSDFVRDSTAHAEVAKDKSNKKGRNILKNILDFILSP